MFLVCFRGPDPLDSYASLYVTRSYEMLEKIGSYEAKKKLPEIMRRALCVMCQAI